MPVSLASDVSYVPLNRLHQRHGVEFFRARSEGALGFAKVVMLKQISMSHPNAPARRRLAREAVICSRLNSHNVVGVYDFYQQGDRVCLTMELVDGVGLDAIIATRKRTKNPVPTAAVLALATQLLDTLDYLHRARDPKTGHKLEIVHRALTPDHIIIDRCAVLKLSGFGYAQFAGEEPAPPDELTRWSAPEALQGTRFTPASDVYSVAVILYELLCLRSLRDGPDIPTALVPAELDRRLRDLPADATFLAPLFKRALAPNPMDRYRTAGELVAALRSLPKPTGANESPSQLLRALVEESLFQSPAEAPAEEVKAGLLVSVPAWNPWNEQGAPAFSLEDDLSEMELDPEEQVLFSEVAGGEPAPPSGASKRKRRTVNLAVPEFTGEHPLPHHTPTRVLSAEELGLKLRPIDAVKEESAEPAPAETSPVVSAVAASASPAASFSGPTPSAGAATALLGGLPPGNPAGGGTRSSKAGSGHPSPKAPSSLERVARRSAQPTAPHPAPLASQQALPVAHPEEDELELEDVAPGDDTRVSKLDPERTHEHRIPGASSVPFPAATVPMATAPMATIPMATAPMATAPMATIPMATAPMATIPMATAPMATIPMATIPMTTIPSASPAGGAAVTMARPVTGTSTPANPPGAPVGGLGLGQRPSSFPEGVRPPVAEASAAAPLPVRDEAHTDPRAQRPVELPANRSSSNHALAKSSFSFLAPEDSLGVVNPALFDSLKSRPEIPLYPPTPDARPQPPRVVSPAHSNAVSAPRAASAEPEVESLLGSGGFSPFAYSNHRTGPAAPPAPLEGLVLPQRTVLDKTSETSHEVSLPTTRMQAPTSNPGILSPAPSLAHAVPAPPAAAVPAPPAAAIPAPPAAAVPAPPAAAIPAPPAAAVPAPPAAAIPAPPAAAVPAPPAAAIPAPPAAAVPAPALPVSAQGSTLSSNPVVEVYAGGSTVITERLKLPPSNPAVVQARSHQALPGRRLPESLPSPEEAAPREPGRESTSQERLMAESPTVVGAIPSLARPVAELGPTPTETLGPVARLAGVPNVVSPSPAGQEELELEDVSVEQLIPTRVDKLVGGPASTRAAGATGGQGAGAAGAGAAGAGAAAPGNFSGPGKGAAAGAAPIRTALSSSPARTGYELQLVVIAASGVQVVELPVEGLHIGRSVRNDLVLADSRIAARHAQLVRDAEGVLLRCTPGETVEVRGARLSKVRITPGIPIMLGQFQLLIPVLPARQAVLPVLNHRALTEELIQHFPDIASRLTLRAEAGLKLEPDSQQLAPRALWTQLMELYQDNPDGRPLRRLLEVLVREDPGLKVGREALECLRILDRIG